MFTWLNKLGVQSDRGFVVLSTGRFTIDYREGGRKIEVYVERGFTESGKACVTIEPTAFERWDEDPHALPKTKQDELLANFTEAMEFQGLAVIVE